jgi:hypothetical protein
MRSVLARRTLADHRDRRGSLPSPDRELLRPCATDDDLVDEQHIAVLQVGEDRRRGRPGRSSAGTRCDVQLGTDLVGDDVGQRCLAQTRWAGEEHVVGRLLRLAPAPRMTASRALRSPCPTNSASERGRRADAVVGFVDHLGIARVGIEQLVPTRVGSVTIRGPP